MEENEIEDEYSQEHNFEKTPLLASRFHDGLHNTDYTEGPHISASNKTELRHPNVGLTTHKFNARSLALHVAGVKT
jgi:hypothetical protein